jgi:peptidoglycan/xylan/chitin deacetylase (PgdA/CDA1 family)
MRAPASAPQPASLEPAPARSEPASGGRSQRPHWPDAVRRRTRVPILMYHRLTVRPEPHPFSLVAARFRRQLAVLRALGYRSVSPTDIARATVGELRLARRSIAITFDDGYLDTLTVALPLLREFGFTAVCYVVLERVGRSSDWTAPAPLMDWADLRRWLAEGMAIGSHSRSHRDLTLLSAAELREEVEGSRAGLEDRLGVAVPSFAYPFNRCGARELDAVRTAGYAAGCAGPELRRSVFGLTRVAGACDSLGWFLLQLLPSYPELRHLYRRIHRTSGGQASELASALRQP